MANVPNPPPPPPPRNPSPYSNPNTNGVPPPPPPPKKNPIVERALKEGAHSGSTIGNTNAGADYRPTGAGSRSSGSRDGVYNSITGSEASDAQRREAAQKLGSVESVRQETNRYGQPITIYKGVRGGEVVYDRGVMRSSGATRYGGIPSKQQPVDPNEFRKAYETDIYRRQSLSRQGKLEPQTAYYQASKFGSTRKPFGGKQDIYLADISKGQVSFDAVKASQNKEYLLSLLPQSGLRLVPYQGKAEEYKKFQPKGLNLLKQIGKENGTNSVSNRSNSRLYSSLRSANLLGYGKKEISSPKLVQESFQDFLGKPILKIKDIVLNPIPKKTQQTLFNFGLGVTRPATDIILTTARTLYAPNYFKTKEEPLIKIPGVNYSKLKSENYLGDFASTSSLLLFPALPKWVQYPAGGLFLGLSAKKTIKEPTPENVGETVGIGALVGTDAFLGGKALFAKFFSKPKVSSITGENIVTQFSSKGDYTISRAGIKVKLGSKIYNIQAGGKEIGISKGDYQQDVTGSYQFLSKGLKEKQIISGNRLYEPDTQSLYSFTKFRTLAETAKSKRIFTLKEIPKDLVPKAKKTVLKFDTINSKGLDVTRYFTRVPDISNLRYEYGASATKVSPIIQDTFSTYGVTSLSTSSKPKIAKNVIKLEKLFGKEKSLAQLLGKKPKTLEAGIMKETAKMDDLVFGKARLEGVTGKRQVQNLLNQLRLKFKAASTITNKKVFSENLGGGSTVYKLKPQFQKQLQTVVRLNLQRGAKTMAKQLYVQETSAAAKKFTNVLGLSTLAKQTQKQAPKQSSKVFPKMEAKQTSNVLARSMQNIRLGNMQLSTQSLGLRNLQLQQPAGKQSQQQRNKLEQILSPSLKLSQSTRLAQEQLILPKLFQQTTQRQTGRGGFMPRQPPPPPPAIDFPDYPQRRKKKLKPLFKNMRRPFKYTATLRATIFKIKGRRPRIFTGVSLRPLRR